MKGPRILAFAAIAALSAAAHAQTGQAGCERLRSFQSDALRILTAEYSTAGEFRPPVMGSFNPPPIMLPSH